MATYDHKKIENKWRKYWDTRKLYELDLARAKKPFYNLMMFPYPSAEGLHIGNVYAFVGADVYGRYKRLQGYDVFEPIGYDAFGIHSENYAIRVNRTPQDVIGANVKNFEKQLKRIGNMYDWSRTVTTYDPDYYKWTQWIFLKLFENDLAYKKKAPVNWCPSCKTVLADEQVEQGMCERCDTPVIQKDLEQWFIKITDYAEKLLAGHAKINWSKKTLLAQKNWIGRSEGMTVNFTIEATGEKLPVFTTRPDTLFGVTYLVLAPENPLVAKLCAPEQKQAVQAYSEKARQLSNIERTAEGRSKTGVSLKAAAVNPVNGEKVPIWVADYVLATYGTGAVMAVPAHDARDYEFAQIYNLPIKSVIQSGAETEEGAYEAEGIMINSGEYDGLPSDVFRRQIIKAGIKGKWGVATVNYKLRDWLISRQRYWGPPIPIIYCEKCGTVPVPEKDLPVKLPRLKEFKPSGSGQSPLADVVSFVNTKCPQCGVPARRETDVTDTFLDSAWYYLRYPSSESAKSAWDKKRTKKWLPVNQYTGGNEHAVLHLMYTRFLAMFFAEQGLVDFSEPFPNFFAHGLIIKDGAKMSKSRGNVVVPDDYLDQYGTDVLRTYLMFIGPYKDGGDFRDAGITGITRFLIKIDELSKYWRDTLSLDKTNPKEDETIKFFSQKLLKDAAEKYENYEYNTIVSDLMKFVNNLDNNREEVRKTKDPKRNFIKKEYLEIVAYVLAPLAPHLADEVWERLGHRESIFKSVWPKYNKKALETKTVDMVIQVNGKFRGMIQVDRNIDEINAQLEAQRLENVKKNIEERQIIKCIFINKNKQQYLFNFVVK